MIYCSNCGKPIPDENKFCNNCGAPKPAVEQNKPAEAEPLKSVKTDQDKVAASTAASAYQQPAATPIATYQQPSSSSPASGSKNAFFSNIGFWGALLLLIGFFLPFYKAYVDTNISDISLATMAGGGDNAAGRILLFLLPVSAIILIIQAFTYAFNPVIANIAKVLPLLLMVFALGAIMREDESGRSLGGFFEIAQPGVYLTLLGAFLMLFFRRKR